MNGLPKEQIDEMNNKLMEALDPTNDYTHEQFMEDYGGDKMKLGNPNFMKLEFKYVNKSDNPDPEYATEGSSGFDLRANIPEGLPPITLRSGEHTMVPTGLYFEIPPNFEIQVRPRSGLAAKHGVTVLNTPGTVDADYRGEVKVILINHGPQSFTIEHGDRIAQAVISTVTAKAIVNLNKVDSIDDNTERNAGGFGSTGIK